MDTEKVFRIWTRKKYFEYGHGKSISNMDTEKVFRIWTRKKYFEYGHGKSMRIKTLKSLVHICNLVGKVLIKSTLKVFRTWSKMYQHA